jgi:hypothetical protein
LSLSGSLLPVAVMGVRRPRGDITERAEVIGRRLVILAKRDVELAASRLRE